MTEHFSHPTVHRRQAIQAGAIALLGLGTNHPASLQTETDSALNPTAKNVVFIFLSGGLGQLDSFDLKPHAPVEIRGEFRPISTKPVVIEIC